MVFPALGRGSGARLVGLGGGGHRSPGDTEIDADLIQRVLDWDLSPTGPWCGAGEPLVAQAVADLETQGLAPWTDWIAGLARAGLRQERRALRVRVSELAGELEQDGVLRLAFRLPAGAYATAVLRELGDWLEPDQH